MTTYPCRGCRKDAGPSYSSHPMTDLPGTDDVNWGDTAIILCDECERATHGLKAAVDFINWRDRTHPRRTDAPRVMTVEVWVAVGENEEFGIGEDSDDALGNLGCDGARRLVKVLVTIPVPEPVVVTAAVGPEPANVTVAVA